MSGLRQARLVVVGATIGAILGSIALRASDDLRPVAVAVAAGAILLGLSFAMQWFASQPVARLAPAYSSLVGRVAVTFAAALSVVLVFNLIVAPDAPRVPARLNAQPTVGPVLAAPSQIAGPTNPVATVAPDVSAVPVVPASPEQVVRPPAATSTASSPPPATMQPASSPAATSLVSPFATPQAPQPSPPRSAAATTSPPTTIAPATPQPTGVPSPPSIIPTLPPLPTIRLPQVP